MAIGLKIKEIASEKKLSIPELAKKLGKSKQTVYEMLDKEDVNTSILRECAKIFDVPITDFFVEAPLNECKEKTDSSIAHHSEVPGEGIPMIPLSAMAGALTDERTVIDFECERYIVPAFNGADFLIPVKGTSMEPTYKSGDIVACTKVPMRDLFFQWNHVYVVDTNQGPLIKRIKPGSDEQHILIVSDNKEYDPFELPYTAINAVALVIGTIRLE